jgi:hypothetical protein
LWSSSFSISRKFPFDASPRSFCVQWNRRSCLSLALGLLMAAPFLGAAEKLTFDERVELVRGLMAEYATAKTLLPRSKKALGVETNGTFDKTQWDEAGKEYGPAARVGDTVQITKVDLENDKIVLQINGGFKGGRKWYQGIQIGMGNQTSPISTSQNSAAPGGTTIELLFHKPLTPMKASEVKKMLAPILDFAKRSATETYVESLPPEIQKAVKAKKVVVGMNRDQVLLVLGQPEHKLRQSNDGVDTEDWIYGTPPGKIIFVTFTGSKVTKVKEDYAGLGSQANIPPPPI